MQDLASRSLGTLPRTGGSRGPFGSGMGGQRVQRPGDGIHRRILPPPGSERAPAPAAAAHAREAIRGTGQIGRGEYKDQDATFALPRLYGTESAALFDPSTGENYTGPRTVYTLLGDGIKGLHSGYVGRRREVQRLVPALRRGETTFAVITGIGGTGKSTLATRAANRLQAVGYGVIPVKVSARPTPAEAARGAASRLIGALDGAFLKAGRQDLHALLTDGDIPLDQRLQLAVDGLNEMKLVLVLDNLEDALDLETRRIAGPELAGFYGTLASNLTHGSRAIITCRYLPDGMPTGFPNVLHLPLPEFLAQDAFKFLKRNEVVRPADRPGRADHESDRSALPRPGRHARTAPSGPSPSPHGQP